MCAWRQEQPPPKRERFGKSGFHGHAFSSGTSPRSQHHSGRRLNSPPKAFRADSLIHALRVDRPASARLICPQAAPPKGSMSAIQEQIAFSTSLGKSGLRAATLPSVAPGLKSCSNFRNRAQPDMISFPVTSTPFHYEPAWQELKGGPSLASRRRARK